MKTYQLDFNGNWYNIISVIVDNPSGGGLDLMQFAPDIVELIRKGVPGWVHIELEDGSTRCIPLLNIGKIRVIEDIFIEIS